MGRFTTSLDGPEAAVAEGFDDGVVLDELLGVRVGELDRTAPAEEVLGRSDGGTELGIDGVAPVGGQARDGVDVDFAEDAGLVLQLKREPRNFYHRRRSPHHLWSQGRVWQESARDYGSLKMYATRRTRARCPRTGVSLHSCIHSSPLRKQSVEGRP